MAKHVYGKERWNKGRDSLYSNYGSGSESTESGVYSEPHVHLNLSGVDGSYSKTFNALHVKEWCEDILKQIKQHKVRSCKKCGKTIDKNTRKCHG